MDIIDRTAAVVMTFITAGGVFFWLGVWVPENDRKRAEIMDCMADVQEHQQEVGSREAYDVCMTVIAEKSYAE